MELETAKMDDGFDVNFALESNYKDRLLELAVRRNSIIFVSSECDKRYIAMHMIKYFGYETVM